MRTYQDTLGNEGDSAVHRSVGNVHVIRRKASLKILQTLIMELGKRKKRPSRMAIVEP